MNGSANGVAAGLTLSRMRYFVSPTYRCPDCQGPLAVEDLAPSEPGWRCLGCEQDRTGYVLSVAPHRRRHAETATEPEQEATEMVSPTTIGRSGGQGVTPMPEKSWNQLAEERLRALLARINAMTELQREAEKIYAVLTLWGRSGLPSLPWVGQRKPRPSGASYPKRPLGERSCAGCGTTFTAKHPAARFCSMSCANRTNYAARQERAARQGEGREATE